MVCIRDLFPNIKVNPTDPELISSSVHRLRQECVNVREAKERKVCYSTRERAFRYPELAGRLIAFVKGRKLIEFNVRGSQLVHPFHVRTRL